MCVCERERERETEREREREREICGEHWSRPSRLTSRIDLATGDAFTDVLKWSVVSFSAYQQNQCAYRHNLYKKLSRVNLSSKTSCR